MGRLVRANEWDGRLGGKVGLLTPFPTHFEPEPLPILVPPLLPNTASLTQLSNYIVS